MKNLIIVDFKNKKRIKNIEQLTNKELNKFNQRITEINNIVETCNEDDIIDNLSEELDSIVKRIEESIVIAKILESKVG